MDIYLIEINDYYNAELVAKYIGSQFDDNPTIAKFSSNMEVLIIGCFNGVRILSLQNEFLVNVEYSHLTDIHEETYSF